MEGLSNRGGVPGVPGEKILSNAEFRVSNFEWRERKGPAARVFRLRRAENSRFQLRF